METKKVINIQLFILLSAAILYFAKPVLMPLAIAGDVRSGVQCQSSLSLVRRAKSVQTVAAALICGLPSLPCWSAAIVLFIIWHVQHIAADFFPDIHQHFADYIHGFRKYLHDRFGMDTLKKDASPLPNSLQPDSDGISRIAASLMGCLIFRSSINLLLILVYMTHAALPAATASGLSSCVPLRLNPLGKTVIVHHPVCKRWFSNTSGDFPSSSSASGSCIASGLP